MRDPNTHPANALFILLTWTCRENVNLQRKLKLFSIASQTKQGSLNSSCNLERHTWTLGNVMHDNMDKQYITGYYAFLLVSLSLSASLRRASMIFNSCIAMETKQDYGTHFAKQPFASLKGNQWWSKWWWDQFLCYVSKKSAHFSLWDAPVSETLQIHETQHLGRKPEEWSCILGNPQPIINHLLVTYAHSICCQQRDSSPTGVFHWGVALPGQGPLLLIICAPDVRPCISSMSFTLKSIQ